LEECGTLLNPVNDITDYPEDVSIFEHNFALVLSLSVKRARRRRISGQKLEIGDSAAKNHE
jgi:hypothetical protein